MADEKAAAPPYGKKLDAVEAALLGHVVQRTSEVISRIVGPGYTVSVLVRHGQNPGGHIFAGDDPIEVAANAFDELLTDPGRMGLGRADVRVP